MFQWIQVAADSMNAAATAYYISGWLLYVTVGTTAAESMNAAATAYYISGWLLYVTVGTTAAESMNTSASILYFRLAAVCYSGYNSC
jgi:hypothetical protein